MMPAWLFWRRTEAAYATFSSLQDGVVCSATCTGYDEYEDEAKKVSARTVPVIAASRNRPIVVVKVRRILREYSSPDAVRVRPGAQRRHDWY